MPRRGDLSPPLQNNGTVDGGDWSPPFQDNRAGNGGDNLRREKRRLVAATPNPARDPIHLECGQESQVSGPPKSRQTPDNAQCFRSKSGTPDRLTGRFLRRATYVSRTQSHLQTHPLETVGR